MAKSMKVPSHVLFGFGKALCQVCGARKAIHGVTATWLARHRHGSVKFGTPITKLKRMQRGDRG